MLEEPKNKNRFYVTTPIYYVNDKPHIGHAYTTIIADTIARYKHSLGYEVILSTGTDENSQKTVEASSKAGETPTEYTEKMAEVWQNTWNELKIRDFQFIRTTEDRHKSIVHEIWKRIWGKGDIYKGKYEGLYCKGHEAFMKESDLVNGLCPDHQTKPEFISEENYFFKLSQYENDLLKFYEDNPNFVLPETRFNEVKSFVKRGLEDISISRESQKWGIPVPDDSNQVIYVWFDALINYISVIGIDAWKRHPADIHTIGKDILRFHSVIWPAMLISAGLPLPKQIAVNGFFTIDGVKISKSLGNAVDPLQLSKTYGVDALRYFLLREILFGEDGDFSENKLRERYNADLANGLGNFAARVLALGEGVKITEETLLHEKVDEKIKTTRELLKSKMDELKFHEALMVIWNLIEFGDHYINDTRPWEADKKDVKVIFSLIVILDNVAGFIKPFLPETSHKITQSIQWSDGLLMIKKTANLFPRLS